LAGLVGFFLRAVHDRHPVAPATLQLADCTPLVERARKLTPEWSDVLADAVARLQEQFAAPGMADVPAALIHGDLSLSNLLWDERRRVLHVVDFEHSRSDSVLFDLAAWIYGVRVALFRPFVRQRTVRDWESGFRDGYQLTGSAAHTSYTIAELIAVIWVFGYFLPQRIREREARATNAERLRRLIYRRVLMKPLLQRRLPLLQQIS
jgi:Ser/Thr protein kinase RdoA (MazF antagonist)